MIPKMSFVMPLRVRTTFTSNALPTVIQHAEREHEIILVLDKCPLEHEYRRRPDAYGPCDSPEWAAGLKQDADFREHVYRWFDEHHKLLDQHHVRVLEFQGDERYWTGGLRMSGALNMGVAAATTEWIVGVGDEDLAFMPGWDRVLWETSGIKEGRDPNQVVANMVMVTLQGRELGSWPEPLTLEWIQAQRKACPHYLTFPIRADRAHNLSRISYSSFKKFCDTASMPGIIEEPCGARIQTHWVPELMYKPMLVKHGMWPTDDGSAYGPDIVQDDRFGRAGVMRRMASHHMVLHAKQYLYMNEEWDRVWVDQKIRDIKDVL
jgi:hypothetical protein